MGLKFPGENYRGRMLQGKPLPRKTREFVPKGTKTWFGRRGK